MFSYIAVIFLHHLELVKLNIRFCCTSRLDGCLPVQQQHTGHFVQSCFPPEFAEQTVLPWQETNPQVQRFGDPLPTFDAFKAKSVKMRSKTVQDVWALMLTSVPGESPFSVPLSSFMTVSLMPSPHIGNDILHSISQ